MASIIKADNIQKVSDGSNIIKKCGSTITLGSCGATISLACGATQTGFGQTYSAVEYCTTAKTSPFTAAAGTGYFINTTCGAVTVTLPASPTAGDVVAFKDYASQWNTNAVTLCNNGNKINGVCATASLSTQNQSVSLIYVDATKGWQDIQDSTAGVTGAAYITATGGTISTSGNYKIHTFTSDATFCVSALSNNPSYNNVDYLIVAGGGGTGLGGGGAGGYRESKCATTSGCWTASPLASATSLPVSVTTYPITVGGGGSVCTPSPFAAGGCGSNSIFSTITSTGGGGSFGQGPGPTPVPSLSGKNGGSGGGGSWNGFVAGGGSGGSGNTPPTSPPQGNSGGAGYHDNVTGAQSGGGGGATAAGVSIPPSFTPTGGTGGAGAGTGINPSCTVGTPGPTPGLRYFAGGGGARGDAYPSGDGGVGGGGGASNPPTCRCGQTNTGGGAYGNTHAGGSGIVIIRYKYQ
jgi:hypothetical protein